MTPTDRALVARMRRALASALRSIHRAARAIGVTLVWEVRL